MTRAVIMAVTRFRIRDGFGSISSSRPRERSVPSTAATCPWGRLRMISNPPSRPTVGGSPFSTRLIPSTCSGGRLVMLPKVRFLTFPPSR